MRAVRMYARAVLRKKVAGTIAVALLVGIAGAAVLGALAGARRTESAYPRLLASEHVGDVTISPQSIDHVPVGPIRRLPHVQWAEARKGFILASRSPDGVIDFQRDLGAATVFGSPRPRELYRNDQAQLLDGRLPDPTRVDEGAVNEIFAKHTGLGVGDTYHAWLYRLQDVVPLVDRARALGRVPNAAELRPVMTPVDFHITGIGRTNTDLVVNENQSNDGIFATPAFVRRYPAMSFLGAVSVKLRDPARDTAAFERAVRRRLPDLGLDIEATADQRATFARVVGPYGDALRFFALAAALTGLFVVGQALSRLVTTDAGELETLDALGTTRRQRAIACAHRAVVAVLAGCVIAVAAALLVSTLFPIGRARDAEPASGLRFDGPVLLLGAVVIVVAFLVPILVTARARVRQATRSHVGKPFASSRLVSLLARRGAPVGAVTGVRFAVQREREGTGSSLVTTLVGVVAAITAITAALVFAANLDDLVTSPSHYGWTWGLVMDSYTQQITPDFADRVRADRDFTAITVGSRASIVLAGHTVPAFGFRRVTGGAALDLPAGRMPKGAHEVALGAQTLRDLGRSIGDTVMVRTAGGAPLRVKIVGRVLLPSLTVNSSFGLGEGAAFDGPAMRRVDSSAEPAFFLVDLATGASERAVAARYGSEADTYGARRPGDIVAYSHVRWTPLLLAGLLAVLAAGVLAHLLVTAVRTRRRDLAVLKTLGFTRRQIASSVAWLATTLIGLSLIIGIPLGLVAGRWTWRSFADDLGIDDAVAVPLLALVTLAVVAVLLANLVAALPARTAARTRAAVVLRSE